MRRASGLRGQMAPVDLMHQHTHARAPLDRTAVQYRAEGNVVGGDKRFEHRDVKRRALPRAPAAQQRRADRTESMRARQHVGGLQVRGTRLRRAAAFQIHHAGNRIDEMRVRLQRTPRPTLTEAGDRAVDKLRMTLAHRHSIQTVTHHDPGRKILHHDIGPSDQIERHRAALRSRQIDRDAALAGVQPHVVAALIAAIWIELVDDVANLVTLARAFDFDYFCA